MTNIFLKIFYIIRKLPVFKRLSNSLLRRVLFKIKKDKFYYNFKDVKEAIAVAKNVLLKSGAKYDLEMAMEMEDEYSEEEFDLENAYIPETEERIIQRKVDSF